MSNVKIVLLQHETYALANTQMESHFSLSVDDKLKHFKVWPKPNENFDKPHSKHT